MQNTHLFRSVLSTRLWIGAGAVGEKTLRGVQKALRTDDVDGIIFGSITMEERPGNPGTPFFPADGYTLNSIGLKNLGYQKYKDGELKAVVDFVHSKGKKIIVSVAGDSPMQYAILAALAIEVGADGVELNLGCPNKWTEDGTQKDIAAYNVELTKGIMIAVMQEIPDLGKTSILGAKVSIYEPGLLKQIVAVFNDCAPRLNYVATSNTFPNGYGEDDDTNESFITKHAGNVDGFGGIGGSFLVPFVMGQVKQFRKELYESIAVVAVGGVTNGRTMYNYIKLGADAVQVVSAYYATEDPGIFSHIAEEYWDLANK